MYKMISLALLLCLFIPACIFSEVKPLVSFGIGGGISSQDDYYTNDKPRPTFSSVFNVGLHAGSHLGLLFRLGYSRSKGSGLAVYNSSDGEEPSIRFVNNMKLHFALRPIIPLGEKYSLFFQGGAGVNLVSERQRQIALISPKVKVTTLPGVGYHAGFGFKLYIVELAFYYDGVTISDDVLEGSNAILNVCVGLKLYY